MKFRLKRAYEPAAPADGYRILVDRLWPRGIPKQKLKLDQWMKDIAPSTPLRQWIHGDMTRWAEFRRRYVAELDARPQLVGELRKLVRSGAVTLVYAARDPQQNHALVLKEYLERS